MKDAKSKKKYLKMRINVFPHEKLTMLPFPTPPPPPPPTPPPSTTVEVISGSGLDGQSDGATASFSQPTACCTEVNAIFVCDSATGMIMMITRATGLLAF